MSFPMSYSVGDNVNYPYVIAHKKINLYISIVNVDDLHIHEEIIPDALSRLVESIKSDKLIKHPVIVDEASLVVLDGMHRVAAMKQLGYKRIPVCLVDYENPAISLNAWYRTIRGTNAFDRAISEAKKANLSLTDAKEIDAAEIGVSPTVAAIKGHKKAFLVCSSFQSLLEAYNIIQQIENRLKSSSLEIGHETEADALRKLEEQKVDVVMLTPKLTKDSVKSTALSGKVFAFKSTRHVIPARPMYLNIPLSLLRSNEKSLDELNTELKRTLDQRRLTHMPAGSILDGRRYEEELYLFANPTS